MAPQNHDHIDSAVHNPKPVFTSACFPGIPAVLPAVFRHFRPIFLFQPLVSRFDQIGLRPEEQASKHMVQLPLAPEHCFIGFVQPLAGEISGSHVKRSSSQRQRRHPRGYPDAPQEEDKGHQEYSRQSVHAEYQDCKFFCPFPKKSIVGVRVIPGTDFLIPVIYSPQTHIPHLFYFLIEEPAVYQDIEPVPPRQKKRSEQEPKGRIPRHGPELPFLIRGQHQVQEHRQRQGRLNRDQYPHQEIGREIPPGTPSRQDRKTYSANLSNHTLPPSSLNRYHS